VDAARDAMEHTRQHLFPFDFSRWLTLGFVAFLEQCGRSGSAFNVPGPGGGDSSDFSKAAQWLSAHVGLVMVIAAGALACTVAVVALVLWLNSRGVFMYLDNVVTGRAEVARPWREHAERAWSYFAWSFGLALAALMMVLLILVGAGLVLVGLFRGASLGVGRILALLALGFTLLVVALVTKLVALALRDFAAPIQYALGVPCGTALRLVVARVKLYPVAFLVYVLLKLAFGVVLAIVLMVAACVTCCCALLPVVTQTLLQPAFFFERAWSVFLLKPMGYDLIGAVREREASSPPAPDAVG
jgi:hypothetical protein